MEQNLQQSDVLGNSVVSDKTQFIKKAYMHLAGALAAFGLLVAAMINLGWGEIAMQMLGKSQYSWLIVMAVFMGVSWFANNMAHSGASKEKQYAGLALYVLVQSAIFVPLVFTALSYAPDGSLLQSAALVTGALVAGLSAIAFITKKNFGFLGRILMISGFVAMGIIVAAIIFGFTLGLLFSGIMIIFASASILHSTSNIIHEYRNDQYVAASLSLFSSIALLLWYVLQFFMSNRN